jgi:hypothetical protein
MSNCFKFKDGLEVALPKTDGFKEVEDIDGNRIYFDQGEVVFRPAYCTTSRELRHFVLNHITPHMPTLAEELEHKVSFPNTRSEYDDYTEQFILTINLSCKDYYKMLE